MGKKWDYDVPSVELWTEVFRVLKEGGYLLSFAGTRTQHRMVVNIEDAGFEIRDMIAWVYGSGFPKSHNISKAIDKNGGNSNLVNEISLQLKKAREKRNISLKKADELFCNGTTNYSWYEGRPSGQRIPDDKTFGKIANEWVELKELRDLVKQAKREIIGKKTSGIGTAFGEGEWKSGKAEEVDITISKTEQAKQWEGWGTALKPALEPITMARKPFKTTVAENVLKNGVGGINIDGCRVNHNEPEKRCIRKSDGKSGHKNPSGWIETGRAANRLVTADSKGRFPANFIHDGSDEVKDLFPDANKKATGVQKVSAGGKNRESSWESTGGMLKAGNENIGVRDFGDSGSAARFFYCAKASKQDRNEGLEDFEEKITKVTNMYEMERDNGTMRELASKQNHHPTVKPTDLMRYLVRLVTPKEGIVLDCFMGSGSTGKACALEGFNFVGIDLDKDYCEIAKARIDKTLEDKRIMDSQMKLF